MKIGLFSVLSLRLQGSSLPQAARAADLLSVGCHDFFDHPLRAIEKPRAGMINRILPQLIADSMRKAFPAPSDARRWEELLKRNEALIAQARRLIESSSPAHRYTIEQELADLQRLIELLRPSRRTA